MKNIGIDAGTKYGSLSYQVPTPLRCFNQMRGMKLAEASRRPCCKATLKWSLLL